MEVVSHSRRIQRVRHELRKRDVEVVRVEPVGPNFISVTFSDNSLASFVSDSFDDHVKFMFIDSTGELVRRDYTPRHFDRSKHELTIEFALHGEGKASAWARQARAGQRATIAGPRGSMIIPMDYQWHLLAGDATALPAIHRRLEELPETTVAVALIQVDNAADRRAMSSSAQVDVHWVNTSTELLSALRGVRLPPGNGFAWCAGEASMMAQAREILVAEKGLAKENMHVAAYWKKGASSFHERLDG
jgi:NADPH-dependent ferric siderophore reductase